MRSIKSLYCATILVASLLGCSDKDSKPEWFREPVAAAENIPPDITQNSQSLIVGHSIFGSTSRGTNFECHGETCICDDTIIANHGPDCQSLIEQFCKDGQLTCTSGGWCVCFKTCYPQQAPMCIYTSGALAPGIYHVSAMGAGVYRRQGLQDRTCVMTSQQWSQLGNPPYTELTSPQSDNMIATYSGQVCSGVEAGTWSDTLADGYYRTPGGSIYRKAGNPGFSGKRACSLSWTQYHDVLHDPAYVQMESVGTADFQKRYGVTSGVDPIACVAADL